MAFAMIPELMPYEVFEEQESPKTLFNITVTVIEANQVIWLNTMTKVCVKFGKTKKYSRVKESSERPYYNEHFVFDYEGSLERMMDQVLTISVYRHKPVLRRDKLLASARLDMGAIWSLPGHSIAEKWIVLTHPSDPTGDIQGYLNCEISILPGGGEVLPFIEKEQSAPGRELFIPESLGGGRLKARYIFGVYSGENIRIEDIKHPYTYVRVFFAGLSGETTKRKHTKFPSWHEDIVFTELFPPMYNRFRIDVHLGKKVVCSKYLNLSSISDPTVKGFLPTYGPSFLHLYSPPYDYLGSILVSLETRTVYALYEHERLLGVRRQRGNKILEKIFWEREDFVLFAVIYEVSMLKKEIGIETELSVGLGFGISEQKPENEDNVSETWSEKTIKMDEIYVCLSTTEAKQALYTKDKLPDNRQQSYISNRLNHIAKEFGQELTKIQFLLEHYQEEAVIRLISCMVTLIDNCKVFISGASTGPTPLDRERLKTIIAKVENVCQVVQDTISSNAHVFQKYETGLLIFREILSIVQDPQESFPFIILTIRNREGVIAYTKIHPREVLYSLKSNEKGLNCGIIQTLFLKSVGKKREISTFAGKIDVLVWFGPLLSIGHGLSLIPSGFQDLSQEYSFPRAFVYSEVHEFICRAHFHQGHFLPCDDISGTCEIFIKVYFNCKSERSSIKKALSPTWMETVVIKDILLYGQAEDIKRNPNKIVIEFWNHRKSQVNLIGRFLVRPHVFLKEDKMQPPNYPPPLEWDRIFDQGNVKGEILAMFELIEKREKTPEEEEDLRVITLPSYIKPVTQKHRFEFLFWGIRTTRNLKLNSLNIPRVMIDCGEIHMESTPLKDLAYFPNFDDPPFTTEIELPDNWYFAPPFVMRLFDSRAFGTVAYIGSETKRSLKMFYLKFPSREEWYQSRSTRIISIGNIKLRKPILTEIEDVDETKPLVELKHDVKLTNMSYADVWKDPANENTEKKKWWQRIPFGKKIDQLPGFVPLRMISTNIDPDSDENFYDWWTKYYDSTVRKNTEVYKQELEKEPEFNYFQDVLHTFTMTKHSANREITSFLIKGGVAVYKWPAGDMVTPEGNDLTDGIFSALAKEIRAVITVLIRVYIIRAHKLHTKDRHGKIDPYITVSIPSQTIKDIKHVVKQDINPVFGCFYELEGKLPFDSILKVAVMDKIQNVLIGETEIDIENRYYSRHRGTCGIQKSYSKTGYDAWRDAYKPSEILDWLCVTNNLPEPEFLLNAHPPFVIVARRKFGTEREKITDLMEELALSVLHNWDKIPLIGRKLLEEHVETRTLYNPQKQNIEQGKLEMWVDILPPRPDLPPPVNIKPRKPESFELRAIIWSTQKVKLVDEGIMVAKRHTDIYVKGWLKGKIDMQKTDVHFASLTGEGLFNWRFIFNFEYDREEEMIVLDGKSNKIPPILSLQVWDHDRLVSDDYIGALTIDLRNVQKPSQRLPYTKKLFLSVTKRQVNLFRERDVRGWWPFLGPSKDKLEVVGMVDLELQLFTSEEAERNPAGHGRNEPNKLPDPFVCRNDRRKRWTKGAAMLAFLRSPSSKNHEVELLVSNGEPNKEKNQNIIVVPDGKDTEVGPPIEGEICLLTDSPFRILRAAESGNLDDFNRLFMAEPERLNVRDSKGRAAAHQAAARNRINILQFIANHRGDLNIRDHHGNTPLHIAVEHESLEAIDFLFQFGVEANLLNEKNQAVIHLATELNKPKVLQTIAKYKDKINVNQGGEHGRTALHIAAIYDHDECATILIRELGACPRKPCHNGYYPIHEAAKNASSRTMEVFLQWGEERGCSRDEMISFYDSEGNVPLHSAVHSGDFKAVELCLKSGAKISTQQHDLSTPVHLACAQGALDIVKLMFDLQPAEKSTCLASCDVQKMTPLHCAAMFDRVEIVQYLTSEGADINALDKEKRSPLLLAGSRGGWRTVLALIRLKANIHLKDSNDRNVLHLVVMNGGRLDEFAEAVIKAQSKDKLQELLNEKDRFGCSPLHHASREGHIKSLENLIKLGAVINLKNNQNESPLHFAARYGRYNTVKQLLDSEKGSFIINETDGEGLTPLHIASQQGHTRVVSLLLNRGALLHRDHNGRNPLHLAAMNGYTQTMELLHSVHSHLLDQVDKDGNTALHLATMENKSNSIALLLSMNCKLLYNSIDLSAIDYAIYYKFPEAALAMVTHDTRGQEVMALRSDKHPCVTLALIAAMPRVFESVQDKCITKANCKKDSKSYYPNTRIAYVYSSFGNNCPQIKYSFSCLQCPKCLPCNYDSKVSETFAQQATKPLPALNIKYNFQNYQRSAKENAVLKKFYGSAWKAEPLIVVNAMVQHGRVELLAHPLSQKYLQMKWNSYGKYFHMFHLLLYLLFLVFVTMYSSHILSVANEHCNIKNATLAENSSVMFLTQVTCEKSTISSLEYFLASGILIYVGVNALRELFQLFQQRWRYLMDPTNFVSWLLYLSAMFMVFPYTQEDIKVPCASVTVFLTWFTLLLNLQRFDLVGIYVVMFLEILQTLIKVLIVFSILIIAFGLAFFILLSRGGHISFRSIPMSLMRTFSMMLGEIDFLGTYVHPFEGNSNEEGPDLPFPLTAFFILGLFMVLMPILLMNLLIGLAVGDIESVRRNAQLKRLAMQVVLHTELERKLPQALLEKVDKMELIEYPNDNKCKLGFLDHFLRMWFFNPFSEDGLEMVLENNEDLVTEEMTKMKRKLKDITKILDSQGQLLKLIVQKMEIKTEADEVDEGVSPRELENTGGAGSKWTSPRVRNKLRTALSFSKAHPIK